MIFFKVDVSVRTHPRFLKAGREAKGMWVDLMSYTREHELDGRIPKLALETFEGTAKRKEALLSILIGAGLVREEKDDYVVERYAEKGNQTKAQISKATESNRKRQSEHRIRRANTLDGGARNALLTRAQSRVSSSSSSYSTSNSDLDLEGVQGEGPPRPPPSPPIDVNADGFPDESAESPRGVTTRQLEYQRAYERGIAAGKGAPYAMPDAQRGELHRAISVFALDALGKPWRGEKCLGWVEHTAREFACAVRGREATYYSAYGPKGFLRWLNETDVVSGSDEAAHV